MPSKLASLATLAVYFPFLALCYPSPPAYTNSSVICQEYTIPMTVNPEIYTYNATVFANDYDLVNFVTASSSVNSTNRFYPVEQEPTVQTFQLEVHGTFCQPSWAAAGKQESTVIVATHGIGGDGSYWNSPYKPEKYNFVNAAAKQGYSVFYYDRIGNGQSSK